LEWWATVLTCNYICFSIVCNTHQAELRRACPCLLVIHEYVCDVPRIVCFEEASQDIPPRQLHFCHSFEGRLGHVRHIITIARFSWQKQGKWSVPWWEHEGSLAQRIPGNPRGLDQATPQLSMRGTRWGRRGRWQVTWRRWIRTQRLTEIENGMPTGIPLGKTVFQERAGRIGGSGTQRVHPCLNRPAVPLQPLFQHINPPVHFCTDQHHVLECRTHEAGLAPRGHAQTLVKIKHSLVTALIPHDSAHGHARRHGHLW